ncbi:hypothetical protein [Aliivibrio fischeri]|uniref:hypothetical protein n=1 Tax=Aliivibrio fischeri TaxID=668 RepID=UPI0013243C17|nr:hypothetical protein [Aliivibrio fischeri]MUK27393.1 hypothetical protein [Aliivibrio fischeri]MUK35202.1 hypothetical protein [Aliivibrio fischeri]
MSKISYPRTQTKSATQSKCRELIKRIESLLSKGHLTEAEIEELIALIGHINWAYGARSYRLKALRRIHDLRQRVLREQEERFKQELDAYYQKQAELEEQRKAAIEAGNEVKMLDAQLTSLLHSIALHNDFINDTNELKLEIQTATLLLTSSHDVRSIADKLNQPFEDDSSFKPYNFKELADTNGSKYYHDQYGEILRETDLEQVDITQYEDRAKNINRDKLISDAERSQLESEVDNINTLSIDARKAIFDGWMKGGITHLDNEFEELKDVNKCIQVLNDFGVMFDTYSELGKRGVGQEMFHKYGYQKEHYPPYSCFTERLKIGKESRGSIPLIDGLNNYNEKKALCFAIFDGQHIDEEHYKVTRASEAFMKELQAKGENATLGQWLDKAVEWNAEIFTERLERDAKEPYDRDALAKQGRKAAVAMRNVTQAHFVSLEGSNVLSLKLENGKHRNKLNPKTASRDQNDL